MSPYEETVMNGLEQITKGDIRSKFSPEIIRILRVFDAEDGMDNVIEVTIMFEKF